MLKTRRLTARQRALPGVIAENNRRLAAIDDACSWLAQNLRPDCQPDWTAYPLGTQRYDRLHYRRKSCPTPTK